MNERSGNATSASGGSEQVSPYRGVKPTSIVDYDNLTGTDVINEVTGR
jgi:hypothetical protein